MKRRRKIRRRRRRRRKKRRKRIGKKEEECQTVASLILKLAQRIDVNPGGWGCHDPIF